MTVVADSTPCIYLVRLGDLGILQKMFGRIVLPEAVWRELTVEGHRPGASEFQAALDVWVTVQATRQADLDGIMQAEKLERGEVEAIQLARELRAEALSRGCMRKESFHPSKGSTPCSEGRCLGVGVSEQPPFVPRRLNWPADRLIRHDLALKTWGRETGDHHAFSVYTDGHLKSLRHYLAR